MPEPKFYKIATPETHFTLTTLTPGQEDFSIWDNKTRKFIRKGTLHSNQMQPYEVEGLKYMRRDEFEQLFPDMRKTTKYIRTVMINNELCRISLAKSAEDSLTNTITTLQQAGVNPLQKAFILKKTGSGLSTRYSVEVGGEATVPPVPSTPPPAQPVTPPTTPAQPAQPVSMTDAEKILISTVKGVGVPVTLDMFKETCKASGITDEARITNLYQQNFN